MSSWFKGIRLKLLLIAGIPCTSLIITLTISEKITHTLKENIEQYDHVRTPVIVNAGELKTSINMIARWTLTIFMNAKDPVELKNSLQKTQEALEDFEKILTTLKKLDLSEKNKTLLAVIEKNWPIVKDETSRLVHEVEDSAEKADAAAYSRYKNDVRPQVNLTSETVEAITRTLEQEVRADNEGDEKMISNSLLIMSVSGIVGVLASIVFLFVILRVIIKSLNTATESLVGASSMLATSSEQLSASATEVSSGSSETAASLQETVASLEELNSLIKTTDENSQISLDMTRQTHTQAELSEKKLNELIGSMTEISNSSKKVSDIVQVIDDIAFQTNLLALNAAVEAARAGDQGKGFAVVAEAVRSLAQKSAQSAKEIGELIRMSTEKTSDGVQIGHDCKELMTGMFESLKKAAAKSEEIAQSSQEQSAGMNQISTAMNQLDRATQQNTSASEQISASSNELSEQAVSLRKTVEGLRELVDGANSRNISAPAKTSYHSTKTTNTTSFVKGPASEPDKLDLSRVGKTPTKKNDFGLNDVA
jgi:methyl-accepting chemotaxis protein